jgi:hypothetical protein
MEVIHLDQQCCVCGQTLDEEHQSRCSRCGGFFHMAWKVGAPVPECGGYWIDEMSCALVFACAKCLASLSKTPQQSNNTF